MVWRVLTREQLEKTKQHFAEQGYVMQWYAMASEVILTTLGPEWWKKNFSPGHRPDEFLAASDSSEDSRYDHQDRVTRLGDMLFALKECKGYDVFISSLKARDLAPVFFELWVANSLQKNGFIPEFVEQSGRKGEDYDLIGQKNGFAVSVEAKSRRAGVILSERTLRNTLETARRQLPSPGPGMIFISIPNEWTREADVEAVIGACVNSFFRNSGRVNNIVLIWHQWLELNQGKASAQLVREFANDNPRTPTPFVRIIEPLSVPAVMDPEYFKPSFW